MSLITKAVCKKEYLLAVLFLTVIIFNYAAAEEKIKAVDLSETGKGSLVVYYSRSGKTRVIAEALSKAMSAESIQIKSKRNRDGGLGVFTCVIDQLMDRDDEQLSLSLELSQYDTVYIASPIWLHKLSSPVRTFIKNASLEGKEVYLVLTYNGSQSDEDEKTLTDRISSCGVSLKGLYKINTKNKDESELKQEVVNIALAFNDKLVKR